MRQSAVTSLRMRQASAKAVAQKLGVSRPSPCKWKDQLPGRDALAFMKRQPGAPASAGRAELEQQLDTLRRDIRRLHLERDVLKKANELLNNELGIDRQRLTNREKTQLLPCPRACPKIAAVCGCRLHR